MKEYITHSILIKTALLIYKIGLVIAVIMALTKLGINTSGSLMVNQAHQLDGS